MAAKRKGIKNERLISKDGRLRKVVLLLMHSSNMIFEITFPLKRLLTKEALIWSRVVVNCLVLIEGIF